MKKKKKRRPSRKRIEVILPIYVVKFFKGISDMTGVKEDDVYNVVLALEIAKIKVKS